MAKAAFKMPEDFLLKLSRLGEKTDEIIPKVLEAGGEVVEAKVKSNLQAVIGSGTKEESRSSGELISVTQKDEAALAIGTKVLVIAGPQARIVPDYTVPPEPPAAVAPVPPQGTTQEPEPALKPETPVAGAD